LAARRFGRARLRLKPDLPKARSADAQLSAHGLRSRWQSQTREEDMSKTSTASPTTKRRTSPDKLITTSKKGEIELTEEQLDKAVGGIIVVCDQHKDS
jgi:hypothetical protein